MALLEVNDLRAYYETEMYGISRTVRAVDGVSLALQPNEIYGVAGESSCGKTTLIKVISGSLKAPLKVENGSVIYDFGFGPVDILHTSQSELPRHRALERDLLRDARLDERAQSGAPHHPHL